MTGKLIFEDKSEFEGRVIGAQRSIAGEVVFSTGMVGYPESFTDPSWYGQILVMTYPIIGNYGVPKNYFESDKIKISGLIVSNYIDTPSHFQSIRTLSNWLIEHNIPALEIKDTRLLTQKIRKQGTLLGKIIVKEEVNFHDPNLDNLVAEVSTKQVTVEYPKGSSPKAKTIVLIDCGVKRNIQRCLLKRGVTVVTVPWDFDFFKSELPVKHFDGIVISNGPGDPKMADKTIRIIKKALENTIPTFGICLGNQILTLASGGNTYKLKYGHRSQNQPCLLIGTPKVFITTQNHGFAVSDDSLPKGFVPWFKNANDRSNEGVIHTKKPFMSVQFHPEATPGPKDTEWLFDFFLKNLQ